MDERICDKAEGCKSSCWHKEKHELISECTEYPCPANMIAMCIPTHPTKAEA